MTNLHAGTGVGVIESSTGDAAFLQKGFSTSTESPSFVVISSLSLAVYHFVEDLLERFSLGEISYEELLGSIERSRKLFELIGRDFASTEYLYRTLTLLGKTYTFRRPSEVSEFLSNNVTLLPLVVEAHGRAEEYFPTSDLILEVVADPEMSNKKELAIFIQTTLSPHEAFERLEMFDKVWWLDLAPVLGEKLCVHVEFK